MKARWLAAAAILTLVGPARAAMKRGEAVDRLLAQLGGEVAGDVLYGADFEDGTLADWHADPGCTIVDAPGGGRCVQIRLSGNDHEDFACTKKVPVTPGHPIAVCWRERSMAGSQPLFLRVDFFDENGVTGQPYATQDRARTGADWTNNAILASSWFPEYTRSITIHFHHPPDAQTTSLLDDVRVVDLAPAVDALLARQLADARAALERLVADAAALPASPRADQWRQTVASQAEGLRSDLEACAKLEPGSPEFAQALGPPAVRITRLADAVAALKRKALDTSGLLVYSTRPITSTMVLPDTAELPGALTQGLEVTACPGEAEPISLVLWAPEDVGDLMVEAAPLRGPTGIPASALDIKWVKCWYQAGSAPHGVAQDRSHKVLVPELLLNDDSLVRVDLKAQENTLKLSFTEGPEYIPVTDPKDVPWGWKASLEEFPVRDSAQLLPADLPAGQNKQVWVTLTVPADAKAGEYRGELRFLAQGKPIGRLPLTLRVLPFTLPAPRAHWDPQEAFTYSLYYWGELDPEGRGSIGYKVKSEPQFRAELQYMWDHGIVAPAMIWSPSIIYENEPLFRRHLEIAREVGMSGRPLYFADSSVVGNPTEPAQLDALRERVRRTVALAKEYGFTGVYFYGLDEATGDRLSSQRTAWQAVQEAGGKVIVSGFRGQLEAVGDVLDLCNWCGPLDPGQPPEWHQRGHRLWSYGNPQTPVEDPAVYRRNYGLLLWKTDYDGACTYCFMDSSGTPWNDFDCDSYRDHNVAYPTIDGVVGTLALDGLREGADDVKYATLLRMEIDQAAAGANADAKARAHEAADWLESLDPATADLDAVRAGLIERILSLREAH